MAEPFPISGSIDPRAFPFLLMDLHRNAATGSLKVEGPSYQKALYFRGGRILFGSSNDPRDQLGAILIESGKITPEQLEEVNTKVGPGSPLAKVLSETGFVSQRELSEAARAKVERILSDVIAYSNGTFEFEDGVLPKGAVDLKLSTERLVLAAVRRVADPDFVPRHLEGLDTVLAPTPELAGGSPELRAEASGFVDYIDGQRTVRQAAAAAKLDADEAGRIACGLLFLGMAERRKVAVDAMPTFVEADADDELDLGQTARMAFSPEPGTVPMGAPLSQSDSEEPFFLPDLSSTDPAVVVVPPMPFDHSPPKPGPSTDFEMVSPEPTLPIGYEGSADPTVGFEQSPAFQSPEPTAFAQPEPSEAPTSFKMVTPQTIARPANPEPTAPRRADPGPYTPPPLVRPPSRNPDRPAVNRVSMTAPLAPRPSREDLAALDALLNTAPPEGPLEPMEAATAAEEHWEEPRARPDPHPDSGTYAPRPFARSASRTPLIVAIGATTAAALALAALGWRYFTSPKVSARVGTRPAVSGAASPRPAPTPSAVGGQVNPAPMVSASVPSALPSAAPPAGTAPNAGLPTAAPSAVPLPARTPEPPPKPAADDLGSARNLLQDGRLPEAAGGFVATLKRAPAGTASVQLLVACSNETIQKAVQNVGSSELFIVPVNFKGKDCYRVCWGLYQGEARAASAVRSVPEYFRRGGASPRVVSASEILP